MFNTRSVASSFFTSDKYKFEIESNTETVNVISFSIISNNFVELNVGSSTWGHLSVLGDTQGYLGEIPWSVVEFSGICWIAWQEYIKSLRGDMFEYLHYLGLPWSTWKCFQLSVKLLGVCRSTEEY